MQTHSSVEVPLAQLVGLLALLGSGVSLGSLGSAISLDG
jgi:hypothetical protein